MSYKWRPNLKGNTMEPRPVTQARHSWEKVSASEFVCACGATKTIVYGQECYYEPGGKRPEPCTRTD